MLSASHPTSAQASRAAQRNKLTTSYNALLEEFSAKDLRSVGNYDIGHLIGKGSFGKVYLATHKLIRGSKVVVKSTKKDDANLPREIHHHRQFIHPHIARLYEVVITESSVWLVLEYCPGDELFHYLTSHGPLAPATVQKIFAQLVGAVAYVHGKSCVHRDLKLENILLDKHDNVKLVDFGFTREYEGKASYLQTWCGTVCYSAPEMLKGEKYAGEKVDVWSLGVILYALLCGELPFDEDEEDATKVRILKEEPKYPEHMPEQARELIAQLLSKRPLLRPSLKDVLDNPWLAAHAPQQLAILKVQQPEPFATLLEQDVLQRMRAAGVNTEKVVENVTSQRCDALAGWWALLLEKEERKEQRRQRRRKAREAEGRVSRRVSAASALVLAPVNEEKSPDLLGEQRGRDMMRANGAVVSPIHEQSLKSAEQKHDDPSLYALEETMSSPPAPVRKDRPPVNTARRRSQNGPGMIKRNSSHGSPLQLMVSDPNPLSPDSTSKKLKRRYMQPLASLKQWFKGTSSSSKPDKTPTLPPSILKTSSTRRPSHSHTLSQLTNGTTATPPSKRLSGVNFVPDAILATSPPTSNSTTIVTPYNATAPKPRPVRPALSVHTSGSARRVPSSTTSHSPSPLTPRGGGATRAHSSRSHSHSRAHTPARNSTSSSVSSVRSSSFGRASSSRAHSHGPGAHGRGHSHKGSRGSSSSKSSVGGGSSGYASGSHLSVGTSDDRSRAGLGGGIARSRSPHRSVKVLPAPLYGASGANSNGHAGFGLPSGMRLSLGSQAPVRSINLDAHVPGGIGTGAGSSDTLSAGWGGIGYAGPHSPGLPVFAKRKRSVFRGPVLGPGYPSERRRSLGTATGKRRSGGGSGSSDGDTSGPSGVGMGRLAVTTEEDEEEEEEQEVDNGYTQGNSHGHEADGEEEAGEEGDEEMEVEEVDYFSPIKDANVEVEYFNPSKIAAGAGDRAAVLDPEGEGDSGTHV